MSFQTIISKAEGQFVATLKDQNTNTFAEIFSFGALLNQFCSENSKNSVNVIDGFASPAATIEEITIAFKSAKLSPFACRVKDGKYKFGGRNYQLSKNMHKKMLYMVCDIMQIFQ